MVDADLSDGATDASRNQEGVLANLPRTRPQRSSPRRDAARAGATAAQRPRKPAKAATAKRGAAATATRGSVTELPKTGKRRAAASRRPATPVDDPAPRQGFECESEPTRGSVHPPGGAELVASVAEIFGELAKTGFNTGERLLKDALARLPLS